MNKTNQLFAVAALIGVTALSSCQKENGIGAKNNVKDAETVECTVNIVSSTKSIGPLSDADIKNFQVFVFRSNAGGQDDGMLDARSEVVAGKTQVKLECTAGRRVVAVVANAPADISVTTLDELNGRVSNLTDNSDGNFVMYTAKEPEILGTDHNTVSVELRRLAAKVQLSEIAFDFNDQAYKKMLADGNIQIKRINLINVSSQVPMNESVSFTPTLLYNGAYNDQDNIKPLAYDAVNATASASYTRSHVFYCYPNTGTAKTAIVVAVAFNGRDFYYTIPFETVERNKQYIITKLTIKRPGSPVEGEDITPVDCTFNISVAAWEAGVNRPETI